MLSLTPMMSPLRIAALARGSAFVSTPVSRNTGHMGVSDVPGGDHFGPAAAGACVAGGCCLESTDAVTAEGANGSRNLILDLRA